MEIKNNLKVSIVVIVYNAAKTLSACLDSLMALDFPSGEREIIVVDNNSTDQTKEVISRYLVTYLFEPNQGRGWARNKGAKCAKGEFIAFTDSDCVVTKDWLTTLLRGFKEDENVAICGGEVVAFRQETIFERFTEFQKHLNQEMAVKGMRPEDFPRVVTANTMFRKRILEEAGYFDEDLITGEDTEISWRISLLGYEIKYIAESVVYHQHRTTLLEFCEHHFEYGRARYVLNHKYKKMDMDIGPFMGVETLWKVVLPSLVLIIGAILKVLFVKKEREEKKFFILHCLVKISFRLGYWYSILERNIFPRKNIQPCKISPDDVFQSLVIKKNGCKWCINCQATWFLNDGFMRLAVFSAGKRQLYRLNKIATRIWSSLLKTKDLERTIEEVARHYHVAEDTVKQDSLEFMTMLEEEGILKKQENGSPSVGSFVR